jgi:hypothetical protein
VAKEFIAEKTSAAAAIVQMTRRMNSSLVTFSRGPSYRQKSLNRSGASSV